MADPRSDRFASRVQVISPAGDHVYRVHAEEAARMVKAGQAKRRGSGRRVGQIELLHSLSNAQRGPSSTLSLWQYTGQQYTYREEIKNGDEVVAHVMQLKYIDPRDRAIFLLSVTDCMSSKAAA
jgi:hypothetical protein